MFKESEIKILVLRYKDKVSDYIFDALIEVHPYGSYED